MGSRKWCVGLLLALLVSCISPKPILAQQQSQLGRIIGNIKVSRGDFPPVPVLVTLEFRGAAIESAYTDGQGRFGFYNLAANSYRINISDDSYNPFSELVDVNPASSPMNILQITLIRRSDPENAQRPGQMAGSNPYLVDRAEYYRRFPKKTLKEFEKGVDADKQGKTNDAMQHYHKALSYSQDFYPAHNNLGSAYLSQKNFNAAQTQFEEALKSNENDAQAYFNLANVLLLTQHTADAERQIEEGLKRRPDSAFGRFLQGTLYSNTGRPELAEKSLVDARRLDPAMSQIYLQLVNLYLQEKRNSDAINQLEAYLKAFPNTPFSPKARDLLKRLQGSATVVTAPQ
jgi:tetratricopeptide (TPR) repeat protein